jgi:hypothetical protein
MKIRCNFWKMRHDFSVNESDIILHALLDFQSSGNFQRKFIFASFLDLRGIHECLGIECLTVVFSAYA